MNKKLLGVLGVVALLLAGNFAWQEVKEVDAAATDTIYFKPNGNWKQASAKFDAWTWGGSSADAWIDFTDSNGDGIYEAMTAPGRTGIKIYRRGPEQTSHDWDNNQWNNTGDLTITSGTNLWTQKADVWGGEGTWSSFTPTYYLPGSFNGWDTTKDQLLDSDGDGTYEVTKELEASATAYTFKIALNGTWDTPAGLSTEKTYTDSMSNVQLQISTGSKDIQLKANGGRYTFAYTPTTKKLTITHTSYSEMVKELFGEYYNSGSYTKVSDIYVNTEAVNEVAKYFHTGNVAALHRTTVYTDGRLVMTTEKDTNGVGYKTVGDDMVRFHIVEGQDVNDYTVKGTTVENYYVTLADFIQDVSTSHYGTLDMCTGWTCADGIYSNSSEDVLDAFRLFTAPMWVGKTAETEHYIIFTEATVELLGDSLVMKLWAKGEESKLTSDGGLFSQAVITLN